jgi:hypothetical protein
MTRDTDRARAPSHLNLGLSRAQNAYVEQDAAIARDF